MPFEYLEDVVTSDIAFHAWGGTLDELFAASIDATAAAMVADLDSLRAGARRRIEAEADALDLLLLRVLEDMVFFKDAEGLLLRAERVSVTAGTPHRAVADLVGERIDPTRHELAADVKAVTLHGLRVERVGERWHAHVTLDV